MVNIYVWYGKIYDLVGVYKRGSNDSRVNRVDLDIVGVEEVGNIVVDI